MIRQLWRDAVRLLVRPIPFLCLMVLGAVLGSLVAATRHSLHGELEGLDSGGASIQSLLSGLMLFSSCAGLVFGLLLGNEDRTSGFMSLLAVRPVSRLGYVVGRGLGLASSAAGATATVVATALLFAGFSWREIPELKSIVRAGSVAIDGRALAPGDVTILESGKVARFHFPGGGPFSGEFAIEPLVRDGFTGHLDLSIRAVSRGEVVNESILERMKPTGSVHVEFADPRWVDGEIEIENRTELAALVIGHDSLRATGATSPRLLQIAFSIWLLLLASIVVAMIGFACVTAFSVGPAALTAGFVFLVGLAKSTVLDLAESSYPRFAPMLRLAPDLSRFDASDAFGRGEALSWTFLATSVGAAGMWIAALFAFSAIAVSWRDRT